MEEKRGFVDKYFRLKENKTDFRTEVMAGVTTFMTMAYILAVNPNILADAGMDPNGVFTATALSAMIATFLMGVLAKHPFALASGMGLNAYFTYNVVLNSGYSWQTALTAIFLEGVIFLVLSFFSFREAIFDAIPKNLRHGVTVGIGLFITLIGMTSSGLIVAGDGVLVSLGNLKDSAVLLSLLGVIIMGILLYKDVKGALLIGILLTTLIGIPMGVTSLPDKIISMPPSLKEVAFKLEWGSIFTADMLIVLFTFLFVDIFDTIGTLIGVSSKAGMLDEDGKLPRIKEAFISDAVGTMSGALLGTTTVTTFVESASGVADGGRTGLTAVTTSIMFGLSLFLAPLFGIIPAAATGPALILVGLFMISSIQYIDFSDVTEGLPAFLTIVMMPYAYSIAEGIVFGMVSYVVLKLFTGKYKEPSILMYILAGLFILKEIFF